LSAFAGELFLGEPQARFRGVSIDSRTVSPGELFFCIQGERFDGHDFIEDALAQGASGVVFSDPGRGSGQPSHSRSEREYFAIRTQDTLIALQELARQHRQRIPARVIAVTGTNGKTTTKEMIASIAATKYRTLKTAGNLNNHIGLPLTVLGLNPDHEVAVLEMGMSDAGEIRRLAEIADPDIGVITNISEGHLVHLESVKNVQAAKGELFDALSEEDIALVNADDPLVRELALSLRARRISFGLDQTADVSGADIRSLGEEGYHFSATLGGQTFPVHLPFPGACNVYNALAALAAGVVLGLGPEPMAEGLKQTRLPAQRHEILKQGGLTVINDAYNANPQSMHVALSTLAAYPAVGRKFFVIGDMLELGPQEESLHTCLGENIAGQAVDFLVAVGKLAGLAASAAIDKGMDATRVKALATRGEAVDYLKKHARSGDCLLVKGSRGAGMEEVVRGLLGASAS
jgi:UDP-N-acetylmuramoyl-tripeptide--D-alanyl-D-alanine ligase